MPYYHNLIDTVYDEASAVADEIIELGWEADILSSHSATPRHVDVARNAMQDIGRIKHRNPGIMVSDIDDALKQAKKIGGDIIKESRRPHDSRRKKKNAFGRKDD